MVIILLVSVIAATNYPWMIDDAILSRFSQKIFCDLPSHDAVVDIMQKYLAKKLFVPKLICDPSGNGLKTVNFKKTNQRSMWHRVRIEII